MFHFEVVEDTSPQPSPIAVGGTSVGDFSIGDKIHDPDKHTGTIKYIGKVGSHPGSWLGIEWDNSSRGKHSGTLENTEYFQCSVPNSGSFIRLQKAKKLQSLKTALESRYSQDNAALTTVKSIEDRLDRKKLSFGQLHTLNVASNGVTDSSSDVPEVVQLCPQVKVLELGDNLLESWSFIGSLCGGLEKLTRLDLSKNPLKEVTTEELLEHKDAFRNITHMILGGVNNNWASILKLSPFWPDLTNLQIPFNSISSGSPPAISEFQNVTSLDLEGNQLCNWEEVLKFSSLKKLEYLNLSSNTLKIIRFPAEISQLSSSQTSFFPNLLRLNLSENSVDDWISISELNKLQNLKELRFDLNPLLNKDTRANNRQMILARVANLEKLEGAEVKRQERRDSEIDYVKMNSIAWTKEKDSFRFLSEHPRYPELVKKWGQSELGEIATESKSMMSSLISVTLVPQLEDQKPVTKKVIPTMTVQKLKGLVQRVFRQDEPPGNITVVSWRNPGIKFELEDDFTDLSTYSVEEGDKLIILW